MRFGLDESFGLDHSYVQAQNGKEFEITYNGWGTFEMPITLNWNRKTGIKQSLTVDHVLCFEG